MERHKLRTHLLLNIISFAVIIFIVMAGLLVIFTSNTIENMVYEKTDDTLRIIEVEMEHYLEHPKSEMVSISNVVNKAMENNQIFDDVSTSEFEDYSNQVIQILSQFDSITRYDVLNEDGEIINTIPYSEGLIGLDQSMNNTYKKIKYSENDYVLGEMITDSYLDTATMYVSMKLDEGYLVGYLNLVAFQELLRNVVIDDGQISVVDEYGTYMSHTNQVLVEQKFVDSLAKKIREGSLENRSRVTYQGSEHLLQYQEINDTNWYILYYQTVETINEPIIRAVFTIAIIFVILLPILILILFRIIRLVDKALDNLVEATNKISSGYYEVEDKDFYYDEFNRLFKSVKHMSIEVSEREEEVVSLNQELENNYYTMIVLLAKAIEAKDNYTGNHCERVRDYSMLIGEGLDLSEKELRELKFGATLHDIGKLGIPENVLNKPGKFTNIEYEVIKGHSQLGFDIMQEMPSMLNAKHIILHHHERVDGKGYPYGLKGAEIPLLARIVSVADAFDAMTSDRPYKTHHMTQKEGFIELRRNAGTQFDPKLVEVFIDMVKKNANKT